MGIENGSGIPEFKSENFSRSFGLADKFKSSGVLGEENDPNERNVADEKVREILDTSFEVRNAEGQIHNIEYSSVEHMIEISQDASKTDDAREKAKQALYEVGLALSQDNAIFKAATEGEGELEKLLPSRLHKIQPYILSSYLTEGDGDKAGKELLGEMMDLFKLKRRADKNPEYYRDDFESRAKGLFTKLMDKCDDATPEDISKGRVGRWEAMMGFVKGIDDRTRRRPVVSVGESGERSVDDEFGGEANAMLIELLKKLGTGVDELPDDFVPEGVNPITGETRAAAYYSRMDITAELLAVSMQLMDPSGARFDAYRPTEWYKKMSTEQKAVIDVMMEVSMAASATYYYGKELDKFLSSKTNFSFTSEKMRTLFDDKFKLVLSRMFNDLCEPYTDQNLHTGMRYKEGFYRIPTKSSAKDRTDGDMIWIEGDNGWFLKDGLEIDNEGFLLDANGKRIPLEENERYIKGTAREGVDQHLIQGKRGISQEVMGKLRMIEDYKGELAFFLAENTDGFMKYFRDDKEGHKAGEFILDEHGKKIPNPMCKMYANTAWNLWYGMGDSSLADRMRFLPTWDKIVSDGVRTLNPEYKFYSKLMIFKTGAEKGPSDSEEAEYFTGNMGDYVIEVMDTEKKLAEIEGVSGELPLKKGDKTMRQKILTGEFNPLPDISLYGFFSFVNGGRDLVQVGNERTFYGRYQGDTVKKTLGEFLMDYAYDRRPNGEKVFISNPTDRRDFNFKKDQVTFMNEFADSWQAAILYNGYIMGKAEPKDPTSWARTVKSAAGMVNGIKFNGEGYFKYVKSPEMWRAMILGCFKPDTSILSSDYIPIIPPKRGNDKSDSEFPYAFSIHDLITHDFGLTDSKVDKVRLMQLLGVDIKRGEYTRSETVKNRTKWTRMADTERSTRIVNLINRGQHRQERDSRGENARKSKDLMNRFSILNEIYEFNADFAILRTSFNRALKSGKLSDAEKILTVIEGKFNTT